jgi:hypothetical protein
VFGFALKGTTAASEVGTRGRVAFDPSRAKWLVWMRLELVRLRVADIAYIRYARASTW